MTEGRSSADPATGGPAAAEPAPAAVGDGPGDDDEWADAEDAAYRRELRKGLGFGAVAGLVAGAVVALLLGAFLWPGYLLGPGDPQTTADEVTTALVAQDATALDGLTCRTADGAPLAQLGPEVLALVGQVAPAGPTTRTLDTGAQTPIDLTVTQPAQTVPTLLELGQSDGSWCFKGLSVRQ